MLKGAWPVFGFFGLDVLLIYIAFKVNYRDANQYERIKLWDNNLVIKKRLNNGKSDVWEFDPYWVQLGIKKNESRRNYLNLSSHGKTISIGSFLSNEEKKEIADTLAIHLNKQNAPTAR